MITLPAVQECVDFQTLARLRLCTKAFYNSSLLVDKLNELKNKVPLRLPNDLIPEVRKECEHKITPSSVLCMLRYRCEVCGKKTRKQYVVVFPAMYGHAQCVVGAFVRRYFDDPVEISVMTDTTPTYSLTDSIMQKKRRVLQRARKWLDLPRNAQLRSRFGKQMLSLCLSRRMFREFTSKKALLTRLFEEYTFFDPAYVDYKRLRHDTVPYIEEMQKLLEQREFAFKMQLEVLFKLDYTQTNKQSWIWCRNSYNYTKRPVFNARIEATKYLIDTQDLCLLHYHMITSKERLCTACASKVYLGKDLYRRRLVQRWKGVARFAGIMATHLKSKPRAKRAKLQQ